MQKTKTQKIDLFYHKNIGKRTYFEMNTPQLAAVGMVTKPT